MALGANSDFYSGLPFSFIWARRKLMCFPERKRLAAEMSFLHSLG
jgi:hypothetical protein